MDSIFEDKAEWQARKKQFCIPDAVCKFSLGDKLEAFQKLAKPIKAGDCPAEFAAWDTIIPTLTSYNAALGALKPSKFTCKVEDQAGNLKKGERRGRWLARPREGAA